MWIAKQYQLMRDLIFIFLLFFLIFGMVSLRIELLKDLIDHYSDDSIPSLLILENDFPQIKSLLASYWNAF